MMSKSIRSQLHDDFPRGWWRSARWWGAAIKRDATAAVTLIAPALLVHKAVFAVRHRRDPVQLARLNGRGFTCGFAGSIALMAMLLWTTASQAERLPQLLGMGWFLMLNALLAGTFVAVLAISRTLERPDWSAIDSVERNGAPDRPPATPDKYEAERVKAFLVGQ